jgi:membrane-bound serine protease (ClpP class)
MSRAVGFCGLALSVLLAPVPAAAQRPVVYRIPVTGTVELGLAPFLRRSLREAEVAGAKAAILDINTLGGRVDAALQIVDAVTETEIPVYAFVHPRAISAGALIAVSTDSVFMTADAQIGASTVVTEAGKASEKAQSVMRAQFRALAERHGRDPRIGEAMVDEEIAIAGVVDSGKLLTLTADEAARVGYAVEVTDFDALLDAIGLAGADVVDTRVNWAEGLVRFLTHPIIAGLLLPIGVLGIFIEIKTPSFGVAGAIGILSLGLFFGSHVIVGLAGWEEIILLLAGLSLIAVEIFIVPGFGVAGIVGIGLVAASVFLALIGSLRTWPDITRASAVTASAALIVAAVIYGLVRHLPAGGRFAGVLLDAATDRSSGYVSGDVRDDLVGAVGTALTDLRPAGTARFGSERLDVVAEGEFVSKGAEVHVVRSEPYRLVVLPTDETESA